MKIKQYHWHHFFGGIALCLLVIQLVTGVVLALFYAPHLNEAYASVQSLYTELKPVAWMRDSHRWAALFLAVAVALHLIRSVLRKDFLSRDRKTLWLTGVLLFLPMMGFLISGVILPWEWRAYWFMEMVPNYVAEIPLIGPAFSQFLLDAFTMSRAFVVHVILLPVLTLVLIDIHALSRIKKRDGGLHLYFVEHGLFALPFLLVIGLLAFLLPMPTEDPAIVPMPLEGEGIPTAEWFILIFYAPYLYFKGFWATFFGFYVPLAILLVLAGLPYFLPKGLLRRSGQEAPSLKDRLAATELLAHGRKILGQRMLAKVFGGVTVLLVALAFFGPFYAVNYPSPTLGCNSCHNIGAGVRMGVPPATFKDREKNPNLKDNTFMVEHWFYPQVVW
ncbi:MAG: cytochrome b N-terminal domain-containing protein [Betaproteobacteria bacterium]|nr:cytochrome b N-terminal domain-containing protein [Betaproteobacteria bacterium]